RFEELRIDLRDQVPLFHWAVEVDVDLLNAPRDLTTDLHGDERLQRARRGDAPDDLARLDRRRFEDDLRRLVRLRVAPITDARARQHEDRQSPAEPASKTTRALDERARRGRRGVRVVGRSA